MDRRRFLSLGMVGMGALAGCPSQSETPTPSETETGTDQTTTAVTPTPTETENSVSQEVIEFPWQQLPGPPGGPVTDISVSSADSDHLYVTSRTGGLYASSNRGERWIQGPGAEHHQWWIVASPHDPEEARTKVNRTIDAGRVWFTEWHEPERLRVPQIEDRQNINDLLYDPTDEGILYAATQSGIYRTTDGGQSWDQVGHDFYSSSDNVRWIDTARTEDGVVFAMGDTASPVIRSEDYGETWESVTDSNSLPDSNVRGLAASNDGRSAYIAMDSKGLFRVGNGSPDNLGPGFSSPYFLYYDDLSLSADGECLYFNAWSLDNEMWDDMQLYVYDSSDDEIRSVQMPERPACVTAHPTEDSTLYFGGWSWVWESRDGGNSWQKLSNLFVDRYLAAVATNPDQPGTVFPGSECSSGIWASHDRGQTYDWKRSGLSPYHDGEFGEHYIRQIATGENRVYATSGAGLLLSDDNGNTWNLLDNDFSGRGSHGEASTPLAGVAVDPNDATVVYVGPAIQGEGPLENAIFDETLIWKSQDGGETWNEVVNGFPTEERTVVQDILVSPHDSSVVYAATMEGNKTEPEGRQSPGAEGIGLFKSTNGGGEWQQLDTSFSNIYSLTEDASGPGRLYASTRDEVFRSADGGENWEEILSYPTRGLLAHPDEEEIVFAGVQKYTNYWDLVITEDGGDTWVEGNLTIQVGREADSRQYDGIELSGDYRGEGFRKGEIIDLAVDTSESYLVAATRGAGLWRGDLGVLRQEE